MKTAVPAFCLALTAAACGWFGGDDVQEPRNPIRVRSVSLAMSTESNGGWPVRVELVRVRDETLAGVLLRIEARNWFGDEGLGFRQANPLALYNAWEVVPGTNIGPFDIDERGDFAGVVFCGTRQPRPPLRLPQGGDLLIYIYNEGCNVTDAAEDSNGGWWPW